MYRPVVAIRIWGSLNRFGLHNQVQVAVWAMKQGLYSGSGGRSTSPKAFLDAVDQVYMGKGPEVP